MTRQIEELRGRRPIVGSQSSGFSQYFEQFQIIAKSNESVVAKVRRRNGGIRAIKVPLPDDSPTRVESIERIRRLLSEANTMIDLRTKKKIKDIVHVYHSVGPDISPVFDVSDEEFAARARYSLLLGPIFIEMRFYKDGTLEDEFKRRKEEGDEQFPVEFAVKLCKQIAYTLAKIHENAITHHDIKPQNIFLAKANYY